ncbi:MAG: helix-turn-helix transcriptional regulator [Verrucomicrobiota bacterium]
MEKFIGQRIEAARKSAGFSMAALGKEIGVSFQQIQKYEAGTNRVSASRLFEISNVVNVPIGFFLPQAPEASSELDPDALKVVMTVSAITDDSEKREIFDFLRRAVKLLKSRKSH